MLLFGGLDFDRALLIALYAGDKPNLALAARIVTELGGYMVLIPATLAGAGWLAVKRRYRSAALLLVISLGGRFLVEAQKVWTARIRPEEYEHLVAVQSLSFPSGHAANSTIVWLSLAFLLTERLPWRAAAIWAAAWLAILIGLSRIMLGVHWPSDVISGWAFGLLWTLGLLRLAGHDLSDGTPRLARQAPLDSRPSEEA
jgi:membrane-associated phospholipid phosphatase